MSNETENWMYALHMAFGIQNIIIFQVSLMLGFAFCTVAHDVHRFAFDGSLPTEKSKRFK